MTAHSDGQEAVGVGQGVLEDLLARKGFETVQAPMQGVGGGGAGGGGSVSETSVEGVTERGEEKRVGHGVRVLREELSGLRERVGRGCENALDLQLLYAHFGKGSLRALRERDLLRAWRSRGVFYTQSRDVLVLVEAGDVVTGARRTRLGTRLQDRHGNGSHVKGNLDGC